MKPAAAALLALCLGTAAWAAPDKKPWPVPAAAQARRNPVARRAESVAEGRKLYRNYCLVCHGGQGQGDGPWVGNLTESPGDLSDPAVMKKMRDGELFWKISQGRNQMPGYARRLNTTQRWHLVNYVRSLVRPPADTKR